MIEGRIHASPEQVASSEEAREALGRVLGSAHFRHLTQLSAFLAFVVNRTLEGREREIKGYTIAVEALGRPENFDPLVDPIVRVEAGRLRKALDDYYAAEGRDDPVRIEIPRGAYIPLFRRTVVAEAEPLPPEPEPGPAAAPAAEPGAGPGPAAPPASPREGAPPRPAWPIPRLPASLLLAALVGLAVAAAGWRLLQPPAAPEETPQLVSSAPRFLPVIRIEPVQGDNPRVNALSQQFQLMLSDALSRFDEFAIVDTDARASLGARAPQATYLIEHRGQLQGETVLAIMRVIHAPTGRVVWTTTGDFHVELTELPREVREQARRIAVRLAQPYGVLHADMRGQIDPASPLGCIILAYDYWLDPGSELHARARNCLESAVRANPAFHPAWSLLAFIMLDEHRIGYNARGEDPVDRAQAAAQRAISLAPDSARALQAMMAVLTVRGEVETAIRTGYEAVRRNPFDTDILADLGARLSQAGRGREGRPLLLRAADLNPARPAWHEFYLFLSARETGDAEGARQALNALRAMKAPLALLGVAIGSADRGDRKAAMAAMRELAAASPIFAADAGAFLDRAYFAPELRARLIEALRRGGLDEIRPR